MLDELLSRGWVHEPTPRLFAPTGAVGTADSSAHSAFEQVWWKLGALGTTLVANLQRDQAARLFERTIQSDKISSRTRGKVLRELSRRCNVFSQGVERFLLDQEVPIQRESITVDMFTQIGLVLAVIEYIPPQTSLEQGAATDE